MSLYLFKVLNNESYDDSVDFEIIPKQVLNDGNIIVKVKSDFNVTNKIGSIQHYHVLDTFQYIIINKKYSIINDFTNIIIFKFIKFIIS